MREEDQILEFLKTMLFRYEYFDNSVCFSKNIWAHSSSESGETRRTDYFLVVNIRQENLEDLIFGESDKDYWKAADIIVEKIKQKKTAHKVELCAA